jgi:4a-hydroxytetrahydrobiopterin dehydratase
VTRTPLHQQHCQADTKPKRLTKEQCQHYLDETVNWNYSEQEQVISRHFSFKDYYQTIAFINAVAWIVHQENHHPDISFAYNSCTIHFTTHSANGITEFDFICAARVNQLYQKL